MVSINVHSSIQEHPYGHFRVIKFVPDTIVDPEKTIAFYKSKASPIKLTLLLDCSGSMNPNMNALIDTACAAVDLLEDNSSVKAFIFDENTYEITPEIVVSSLTRDIIKIGLRSKIKSNNKRTNIQDALKETLKEPNWYVLFLTDGLANVGNLTASHDLIAMCRLHSNYWKQKYFCLGLQINPNDGLNGDLLKGLAIDTNGTYVLASDAESIRSFVGDILNDHYMTEFTNAKIECDGQLITELSKEGFSVRLDKTTTIVYKIELSDSSAINIKALKQNSAVNFDIVLSNNLNDGPLIANVYAGYLIGRKDAVGLQYLKKCISEIVRNPLNPEDSEFCEYWPIMTAIDAFLINPYDEAAHSNASYQMCSAGGADASQTVQILRNSSVQASQDPY